MNRYQVFAGKVIQDPGYYGLAVNQALVLIGSYETHKEACLEARLLLSGGAYSIVAVHEVAQANELQQHQA